MPKSTDMASTNYYIYQCPKQRFSKQKIETLNRPQRKILYECTKRTGDVFWTFWPNKKVKVILHEICSNCRSYNYQSFLQVSADRSNFSSTLRYRNPGAIYRLRRNIVYLPCRLYDSETEPFSQYH